MRSTCFQNFTMDFAPNINVINGPNGSGKSAVLVGLQVVLGTSHTCSLVNVRLTARLWRDRLPRVRHSARRFLGEADPRWPRVRCVVCG
jgi:predicted ATPase